MPGTITVGCKMPNGIKLPAMPGSPDGFDPPVLNGAYTNPSFDERVGMLDSIAYGKTEVDADYWAAFSERFKNWPPLKRGIIFAASKPADMKAKAKDAEAVKTGLEGADVNAKGSGVQKAVLK